MKILAVQPFQEGLRNMLSALNRLETEMKAIETTIETFITLDEVFKGEGGQAIRSFYDEVHLPFIQLFHMMQSDFVNVLERMTAALTILEPHPSGWIQESFLEGEVEQGLDEIARITASLTDEANQIMNKVADIVALPHLDDSNVQDGIYTSKRKRDNTVTELNTFDTEQTNALIAIDNHLQVMERWITDASSLFTENTSDIHYDTGQWAELLAKNLLQTDMAYRGTVLASVMTGSKSKEQLGKDLEATINEMEKVRDKEELEKLYDEMAKYSPSENVGLNRQAYATDGNPIMDFRAVKGPVEPMFGGGMIPPGFGGFVLGAVKGALDFWFLEDVETIIDKDTTFTQKATAAFFLTPFGKGPKAAQKTYKLSRTAMGGKIKKVEKVEGSKQSWFLEGTDGAGEIGWSISKGGGVINGRKYSQHALERMAPDNPEVRASLTSRAIKKAEELGFKPQTKEFSDFIKKYVDPRNIPPSVIEDAIRSTKKTPGNRSGTFVHETQDVKVIINEAGDVITVIPK